MRLTRRRMLAITAAGLAAGSARAAEMTRHRFRALGAACVITLPGDAARAAQAVRAVQGDIAKLEAAVSLWDRASELSRLNRDGVLPTPSAMFRALAVRAGEMSATTGGAFDVTVQARWRALAEGRADSALTDWRGLEVTPARARFTRPAMAASFNGIAQGFAADRAARLLRGLGYRHVLANLGEFAGLGTRPDGAPWRLGVAHPGTGEIAAEMVLDGPGRAVATSEPRATLIRGEPHIFDPLDRPGPRWASVTVRANRAWRADALSTAIAASPMQAAEAMLGRAGAPEAVLIPEEGEVIHWRA